ncbi:MAG: hypothetical protein LW595_04285, partial [Rickettsiales bacterium]|nr:hypothetical protein [Rickettsiales bacterium]
MKNQLMNDENRKWLISEEVQKIIELYCESEYGEDADGNVIFNPHLGQESDDARKMRENFEKSFNKNNIDLNTLTLGSDMQYKLYFFTD